ncbi:MAG: BatA domain-containing protein [Planctomycetes bacterium]|nr:BatA domain-containing protein [Planctomycetota bacterium]
MDLAFVSPAVLWALPLAVLPVLVHLRARAREHLVDFPGAFFLEDPILPSAARRRRMEDYLLLALRCGVLALAIAALAGPQVPSGQWTWATADPRWGSEAWVVVLDDSPSVLSEEASEDAGNRDVLLRLAARLGAGPQAERRRIAVETASGRRLPFAPASELAERLRTLLSEPCAASGDRAAALSRTRALLKDRAEDRRVALLVSDFARNEDEGDGDALDARWKAALKRFDERAAPVLMAFDTGLNIQRQWTIDSIGPADAGGIFAQPLAGQPFELAVRVRCVRGEGTRRLRLEDARVEAGAAGPRLQGGKVLLERSVTLHEGESMTLGVPLLDPQAGGRWANARFLEPDALPFDDSAACAVQVKPKRTVVLWDLRADAPSPASPDDHARKALWTAVDPIAGTATSRVQRMRTTIPDPSELPHRAALVVLTDPTSAKLDPNNAERLRAAVEGGMTLLVLPAFGGKDAPAPGYVPEILAPLPIEAAEQVKHGEASWRLGLDDPRHPLLAPFADGRNGNLAGTPLRSRLRLPRDDRAPAQRGGPQVLARFNDGRPALVYRPCGSGGTLQAAFGIEPGGGIAASAAWPLFIASFIEWADDDGLGGFDAASVAARTPAALSVPPLETAREWSLDGPWLALDESYAKAGRWQFVVPPNADRLALPHLPRTGLYRLRDGDGRELCWVRGRIAPAESHLEPLAESLRSELEQTAHRSGGGLAPSLAGLESLLENLRPDRSIAPLFWALIGLAMALELATLAWRRRTG